MLITLTTDFGLREPYAGIMKGIILNINPEVRIVDLTHDIGPHNVREAAFVLLNAYKYFPLDTIHVAVVDPGVGSGRRAIIVKAQKQFFVGPDNGIFTKFLKKAEKIIHIQNKRFLLPVKGPTFHGRDVFAPVAAWLSRGLPLSRFGPEINDPVRLELPEPKIRKDSIKGEIIHIDRFGNCISNISGDLLASLKRKRIQIKVKGKVLDLVPFYSYKEDLKPHAVINSDGLVEIFIHKGNAARELGIKIGDGIIAS